MSNIFFYCHQLFIFSRFYVGRNSTGPQKNWMVQICVHVGKIYSALFAQINK